MGVLLLVIGLILFVGLVVVHEWGHFIMARRNGVEVEEFGIGFPPAAWRKRIKSEKGDYDFTLNWLPLGGFVKLKGEHDADEKQGTFGAASLSAKVKIMLAGVVMNLFAAFVILTILAWIGMPKLVPDQFTVPSDTTTIRQDVLVAFVEEDSPAEEAGLEQRDVLISIGPIDGEKQELKTAAQLPEITEQFAGQEVEIQFMRGDESITSNVELRSQDEVNASKDTDEPVGHLGIAPTEYAVDRSTWSAPIVAGGLIAQFAALTYQGIGSALGNLITGNTSAAGEQVAGPVGIFVLLQEGTFLGIEFILIIIAVISLTLALINALPIPALDGGRLFVTLLFKAIRKPLTPELEDRIHGTGLALLLLLFVVITIVDINRFF
jgi:regulator of sigma E protease